MADAGRATGLVGDLGLGLTKGPAWGAVFDTTGFLAAIVPGGLPMAEIRGLGAFVEAAFVGSVA